MPVGPNEEVYDFETGQFSLQPERNFEDLGFKKRPMLAGERTDFFLCALAAGVPGLEDYVDYEPRNSLLDVWDDDPSLPNLSIADAKERLGELTQRFDDVFVDDLPDRLPPFRPINHEIFELVEGLKIPPRVIGMPDRYAKQWSAHLLKFVETGYWSPKALESACSMFAVPKHDPSQARFVINLKPPHPVRSKLDFKKAYEQIRLNAESVNRSGFVTKNGTFVSRVMQQGDCNAPDTMHRVCYMMFSQAIGRFLDCFYDDVFVYSHTRRAHLWYLEIVFATLRHYKFYLAKDKVELMSPRLEALGSVVSDEGIEVDPKRWHAIQDWPTPKNPRDILRFMGVMQWMSDHLPHLNELASPLSRLTGNVDRNWSPACDAAFEALQKLVPLKLAPLNLDKLGSGEERLFLFTDASMVGSGGWIGQGVSRETARPVRFHLSKFNSAQLNYSTTDQELLAVLDCCLKFRDHPVGWHFTVFFLDAAPAALEEDPLAKKVLAAPGSYPDFSVRDGFLFIEEAEGPRLVIPRAQPLVRPTGAATTFVEVVVELAHETVGHQGTAKTLGWVRRFFWWSSMHKDVLDYCSSSSTKDSSSTPSSLPPAPSAKWWFLCPLPSTATAEDVASVLFDNVYRRFGTQLAIIFDRDPKFTSAFWRALHSECGVQLKMSSSAHPQTDGQSEVTNKSVGTFLRVLCDESPDDWAAKVTTVEFALNSAPAAATSLSPFEVVYGFLPSAWPVDSWTSSDHPVADSRGERARLDWLRASDAIISARVDMVHQANKSRRQDSPSFVVGSKVYVSTSGMRFPSSLSHKFVPRYVGPFPITAADSTKSSYTIAFPPHLRLHPRIHSSKLRPHYPNDDLRFPSRSFAKPPPAIPATDGANAEWEVEKVVAVRTVRKKRVCKVRYLGYGEADDQWHPEAELEETAPDALRSFLERAAALDAAKAAVPRIAGARRRVGAFLVSLTNPVTSSSGGVGASRC
ncbi:hypothetical protein JCM11641_006980 [Rhodosporidiobolus odoratus]